MHYSLFVHAAETSTNFQTPGALDSLALVLSDASRENLSAREYAAISIGNCGANSEEGAETIVKHHGLMQALILCLGDTRDIRIQETTVVAIKNCAASSQEAAFIIAQNGTTLLLLKDLALQNACMRLRDVVSLLSKCKQLALKMQTLPRNPNCDRR